MGELEEIARTGAEAVETAQVGAGTGETAPIGAGTGETGETGAKTEETRETADGEAGIFAEGQTDYGQLSEEETAQETEADEETTDISLVEHFEELEMGVENQEIDDIESCVHLEKEEQYAWVRGYFDGVGKEHVERLRRKTEVGGEQKNGIC